MSTDTNKEKCWQVVLVEETASFIGVDNLMIVFICHTRLVEDLVTHRTPLLKNTMAETSSILLHFGCMFQT